MEANEAKKMMKVPIIFELFLNFVLKSLLKPKLNYI